ncbi:hypothetical protein HGG73_14480 [Rhodobacteraceae bacterium R_SAG3]|nr:hypothetical protein [Rhodobacteraceae bacterium R_SAG3]
MIKALALRPRNPCASAHARLKNGRKPANRAVIAGDLSPMRQDCAELIWTICVGPANWLSTMQNDPKEHFDA